MWGPAPPSRFDISITQPVGRSDHFLHSPTCHDFATCRLFLLCLYTIRRYAPRPNDHDGAGRCGFSGWGDARIRNVNWYYPALCLLCRIPL
ncbi:hypothetical protein TNIN_297561 [Trichonephila inaurata madagascariensis]|uniref:Uncharacterized protein n=1 Tax=Trichonephila inaurata madagascariensis TaxID=2747483 RepID=A0A8X6XJM0_9ARAC|nr:hypothetical protein TNIN_297561 [Trichonephila inaurata madagascariensis]